MPQPPDIIERSEWGATPYRGAPRPMRAGGVVVHHTAGRPDSGSRENFEREVRRIQRHHQEGNGWDDIGYHFVIGAGGHLARGRPLKGGGLVVGAHSPPNTGWVGVCLLGCFHGPAGPWCDDTLESEQAEPSDGGSQRAALVALLGDLMRRHGLAARQVVPHSARNATACPGDGVRSKLGAILGEAAEAPSCGSVAAELRKIDAAVDKIRILRQHA